MDGILPLYKPIGITSAAAVDQVRKLLHVRRIGHSGTLDPTVDGVLPLAIGVATKAVSALMTAGKTYTGQITLGIATETEDLEGQIVAQKRLREPIQDATIAAAMAQLTGEITQTPPLYSAVKVNGKRLYQYARAGETVERPQRQVSIYAFKATKTSQFNASKGTQTIYFTATVSKGTYIRTLAVDTGKVLGLPAVMSQLTRTSSGGFTLAQTLDLRTLTAANAKTLIQAHLQPIEHAYPGVPLITLSADQWERIQHGRFLKLSATAPRIGLMWNGVLKAIYRQSDELYQPDVMFLTNGN